MLELKLIHVSKGAPGLFIDLRYYLVMPYPVGRDVTSFNAQSKKLLSIIVGIVHRNQVPYHRGMYFFVMNDT